MRNKRMKRNTILSAGLSIILIFLAHEVLPIYATITPKTSITTTITTTEMLGEKVTVTIHRYDTFQYYQHFVSFNTTAEIDGIPIINVITERYPFYKIQNPSVSKKISSIPGEWKYLWDNIWFVKTPGPPDIYIKYDHPNNIAPDGEYRPGETNVDYDIHGTTKIAHHISEANLAKDKQQGTLVTIMGAIIGIIAAALAIPEPAISKVLAGFLALVAAILAASGVLMTWFLENIVETSFHDGWSYLWGFDSWWIFRWWWQSFGAWRDWGWRFVIFTSWYVADHFSFKYHGGGGRCRLL
jgi:hypothetical protein